MSGRLPSIRLNGVSMFLLACPTVMCKTLSNIFCNLVFHLVKVKSLFFAFSDFVMAEKPSPEDTYHFGFRTFDRALLFIIYFMFPK